MTSSEQLPSDISQELQVTFSPALYLQRRGWIFDVLRQENITEVLDVGCGEGELISCLCNPAPWLAPSAASLETLPVYLHPARVHGLDISSQELQHVVASTSPPNQKVRGWNYRARWEPLEMNIWVGGLETFNEAFVGVECIIATEVIEHLQEDVLAAFAPTLLGAYHPRMLVLTTPSYTFNARFTAPDAPPSARQGFRDPTGRTARVFRHDDHQFEWTVPEFSAWCARTAEEWGYEVRLGAVGRAQEPDPWGRDEELGFASLGAVFRRRDEEDWAEERRLKSELVRAGNVDPERKHQLLATHRHPAHDQARRPSSLQDIAALLKTKMIGIGESPATLAELWIEEDVPASCGGSFELLVDAIKRSDELRLDMAATGSMEGWHVHFDGLAGYLCSKPEEPQEDAPESGESETETDSQDGSDVHSSADVNGATLETVDWAEQSVNWSDDFRVTWDAAGAWGNDSHHWGVPDAAIRA